MRVVFDTNIFVSALIFPGGQAEKAVLKIIEGADILIISKEILDEVLSVLADKFGRDIEFISRAALFISDISVSVKPRQKLRVLNDEPDNRVLECAVEGGADVIVTGDKAMLAQGKFREVKIISLSGYLRHRV